MPHAIRSSMEIQHSISCSCCISFQCTEHRSRSAGIDHICGTVYSHGSHRGHFPLCRHFHPLLPHKILHFAQVLLLKTVCHHGIRRSLSFHPEAAWTSSTIGGIPMPPPIRNTFLPSARSIGNPFPSGPKISSLSPF